MTISLRQHRLLVREWVSQNGLDPDFSEKYLTHDVFHVLFGLTEEQEGIVLAIELAHENGELPSTLQFTQDALSLALEDTDRITVTDCVSAWRQLQRAWPLEFIYDLQEVS
jgi:hypothetical protein